MATMSDTLGEPSQSLPRVLVGNRAIVPLRDAAGSGCALPLSLKQGAGGAAPAGGTASPPVPKNVGGRCGRDSGAGHHKPPLLPLSPCQVLLAKYERLCYSVPMKWAASPLRFLEACRIQEHWGPTVDPYGRGAQGASPAAPMAATKPALGQGAPGDVPLAPQPSGEARRRSHRRCEANPLQPPGPATHPRWIRDGCAMDPRWMRDGSAMDARWLRDGYAMASDGYAMPPCLKPPKSGWPV